MRSHTKATTTKKEKTSQMPRLNLLVIDDDPIFLKTLRRAASQEQIAITECGSLQEIDAVALPGIFDVAVVDYYLDGIRHDLRGPTLAQRLGSTPTVLVSQKEECVSERDPWPRNVRTYLNKGKGPHSILEAALRTHFRGAT